MGTCLAIHRPTLTQSVSFKVAWMNALSGCSTPRPYSPRAADATSSTTVSAAGRQARAREPAGVAAAADTASASAQVMLRTAKRSTTQKIRDVCSCTASATCAAMKGSDSRKVAVSTTTPAAMPASQGAARPSRTRQRHTATTTTGRIRFANQAPSGHAFGKT